MAMIKTLARTMRGCKDIKNYLEKEGRSLALDSSAAVMDVDHWEEWMDSTREIFDKDRGRRYYHFIISPDPNDHVDLMTLRSIATSWAQERYPYGEWVIEYHDDNGIPHAHVVLNSVIPSTGAKVHINADDVREDALALQRVAADNNCSVMDGFEATRDEDGDWIVRSDYAKRERHDRARRRRVRTTAQQEWMKRNGIRLWKDDMRAAIEESIATCRTWDGFRRSLSAKGYTVREGRRGQITFYPPEGCGYPTKGYKLDDSYTRNGIRARLAPRIGRTVAGTLPRPQTNVVIPRSLAQNLSQTICGARNRGASERRMQAAVTAINIIVANRFTSISQIRVAADGLTARARTLEEELDETRNAVEQLEEAARRVVEIQACRERMTPRPRGRLGASRWEKENESELSIIADNEAWLAARDIARNATREALREHAATLYAQTENLAAEADRITRTAQSFAEAVEALSGLPCPAYGRDAERRMMRESTSHRAPHHRCITVLDAQQTRRVIERKADEGERLRRELMRRTIEAQRISLMQRAEEDKRSRPQGSSATPTIVLRPVDTETKTSADIVQAPGARRSRP